MWSAAVLVGGRAARFGGRDKSALVVDGLTILERQLEEISQISRDILIVGRVSPGDAVLQHGPRHSEVRRAADRVEHCGPLGGLDAALAAARHDRLVLLACDMPFVTAAFLAHLLALTGNADAAVPRTERGYHPLCAAYTRGCQPAIARRLAGGQLSMVGMLQEVRVCDVDAADIERFGDPRRLLANLNTPADIEALGMLGHRR
jgi:molybdopterin-guanine dinucleotide biosynthesis protein A